MRYRSLGNTGLKVSELGLGAMTFGRETDETSSIAILDKFATAGGNFIDTADVYGAGASESIVGRWLSDRDRDEFVVATKARWPTSERPNDVGLSRRHLLKAISDSLRRLRTEYVDLYQVHAWDWATPLEETLSTLNTIVVKGLARYVGASNFAAWQLQKAVDTAKANRWEPFVSLQPLYNLLDREVEWELIPLCGAEKLGVLPWSPLRGGWLTGKLRAGMSAPPAGTRVHTAGEMGWGESWSAYNVPRTWEVLAALEAVAAEEGRTIAQMALNWLLDRPGITAPIVGARTIDQLEANLGAVGWTMDQRHRSLLDKASARPLPYPYNIILPDHGYG